MGRAPIHDATTSKRSWSDASKSGIFMATSNQNTSQTPMSMHFEEAFL